jgi:hypothetical protein
MKNQTRNYFLKATFLFVALFMFGCSKDEAVSPAAAELSILGKWSILVSRSTENGKSVYDYVGKPGDYIEITNNDFISFIEGDRSAVQYKVIEKNKKIGLIGSSSTGGDQVVEIRNLTSKSMTLYLEYVEKGVTYVDYLDLKK